MTTRRSTSEQVRKKIEDAMLVAEAERKRKLLDQRLALARGGVQAFQKHDMGTAIKSFNTYLRILEDVKGVAHGGLTPQHFDKVKDHNELVVISGIYWDLVKIYDRVTVENQEFQHYVQKYIQFTKGMPFQAVCAETLRKYIGNGKSKHPKEFKAAYKLLGDDRCFIVTSLIDVVDVETLPVLRQWRDDFLLTRYWGRMLVKMYYRIGPSLARLMDQLPQQARAIFGALFSQCAKKISKINVDSK